jgi:hypothetical protein
MKVSTNIVNQQKIKVIKRPGKLSDDEECMVVSNIRLMYPYMMTLLIY